MHRWGAAEKILYETLIQHSARSYMAVANSHMQPDNHYPLGTKGSQPLGWLLCLSSTLCEGPNVNYTYAHRTQLIQTRFD